MSYCSIERLVRLLGKKLRLNEALVVYDHLDHCSHCRELVYLLALQRDRAFFLYPGQSIDQMLVEEEELRTA